MSYKRRKILAASALWLSMTVFMTQQIPAAVILQDDTVQKEEKVPAEYAVKEQTAALPYHRIQLADDQKKLMDDVKEQPDGGKEHVWKTAGTSDAGKEQPDGQKEHAIETAGTSDDVKEQPDGGKEHAIETTGTSDAGEGQLDDQKEHAWKTTGTSDVGEEQPDGRKEHPLEAAGISDTGNEQLDGEREQMPEAAGISGHEEGYDGMDARSSGGEVTDAESLKDQKRGSTARVYAKKSTGLPAPESIRKENTSYHAVTVSWSEVEGAAGYQVEYAAGGSDYVIAGTTQPGEASFKYKKLLTGTKYQLRVCALDEAGKAGAYVSVAAEPYLKKTKFTSVSAVQKEVSLEWKKVAGAMNYELYRKMAGQEQYEMIADTEELSYKDETAAAGESYMYRVCAVRDVDGKAVKAKLSDEAEISPEPQKIQFESCEAVAYNSVKLTWQNDDPASGYYIYRSVKENGTYRKIKTVSSNQTLSYIDEKIVPGKRFYYKICTYVQNEDKTVTTGELSEAVSVQTRADAPELVSVKANVGNRSFSLEWKQEENAAGYRIYRSVYPDKGFKKIADRTSGTFVGYEDRAVQPGGTYYYRIKAIYANGSYKGLSQASSVLEGNLTPAAPIGLTVRQTGEDECQISWNESPGASAYNLYRASSAKAKYSCIAQGLAENTYTDSGLADGKTYFYRVSAAGAGGEGIQCRPVSCTPGGVSMNTRTLKLCVGVSKPLDFFTFLEGEAEWTSDKPQIAEVDSDGMVTGVSYGTANVTVTVGGKSATAAVSVTPGIRNGIDVSRWQEDVDWCRVKNSGIDFAFLRISNHYLEDYTFETKYMNASSVEMPLGVYCYSRAATVEEAQEEARIVLEILDGRELEYPIALDLEDAVHKSKTMTKERLHQIIQAFKQTVEEAGYDFVLYSYLTFLNSNLDKTKLDGIDLWIARYRNVALGTGYNGTGNVKYWQYNSGQYSGSDFHVDGITNESGDLVAVDVNAEYE